MGFPLIKQLLEAGNTCTLRNMNMVVLNASAAPSVNDAYNGRKIVITRFDTDDTILKQEERTIVDYATASSPLPKIASIDVPMPFDFSPEATDFYVIKSGEDEEDIRVSINPAIQLLDYLKDKKHGKGLDDSDIDLASFLSASALTVLAFASSFSSCNFLSSSYSAAFALSISANLSCSSASAFSGDHPFGNDF